MYQQCRWYDVYPRLGFVLQLIRVMPEDLQSFVALRLNAYLSQRGVGVVETWHPLITGHRWYDHDYLLVESLERLKNAPHAIKEQSAEYLVTLMGAIQNPLRCA